jgi:hypothetical protein
MQCRKTEDAPSTISIEVLGPPNNCKGTTRMTFRNIVIGAPCGPVRSASHLIVNRSEHCQLTNRRLNINTQ